MRLSSRRSKVTRAARAGGAPPERSPPGDWLGSISPGPNVMGRLLSSFRHDRPENTLTARPSFSRIQWSRRPSHRHVRGCNHVFVNRFTLLPKFSLVSVVVDCNTL